MRVAVYIRDRETRKYKPASARGVYLPHDVIFCLRYTKEGVRKFEQTTATSYREAKVAAAKKLSELIDGDYEQKALKLPEAARLQVPALIARDVPIVIKPAVPVLPVGTLTVDAAIDRYMENVAKKSSKTSTGYSHTLQQFYGVTGSIALSQVETQHLYNYVSYLRTQGLSDRTVHNRVSEVVTFLRHFGIRDVTLRVKYVEQKVRAYRPDELQSLFAAADAEEWIMFQFYLCTGAREQEVMHAEWSDIDYIDGLFTVKAKLDWTPKDYEEREIPLPDFLVAALKKRMLSTKGDLIFPTEQGKLDGHMLRKLKALANKAVPRQSRYYLPVPDCAPSAVPRLPDMPVSSPENYAPVASGLSSRPPHRGVATALVVFADGAELWILGSDANNVQPPRRRNLRKMEHQGVPDRMG